MSRHFVPITVDELKKKIEDCRVGDQWVEYRRLTPIIEKDLDKVIFDTENISDDGEPKDLLGGDWESPVFFCIYWDGRKLRAYVPEKGNLWNTDTNQAYGNDDEADLKNARKRWPDSEDLRNDNIDLQGWFDDYDVEAIKEDIMARIVEIPKGPLTKPEKGGKVSIAAQRLPLYSDQELLDELKRRLDERKKHGK